MLGAARSDCGVASATMSQCIHSLRQGMKGPYCTCDTILVESRHPFERISNNRTCVSQRATRADRVGERRRPVRVSSIATIGSYVCACQLGAASASAAVYRSNLINQRLSTLQYLSGDVR